MSAGPIKAARDAWKPIKASTPDAVRRCYGSKGRGYCGRRSAPLVGNWADVVCADYVAAAHADGLAVA